LRERPARLRLRLRLPTTADYDEKTWGSSLAPEDGFLPGTADLLYGRLARANRFAVIHYFLQQEFIPCQDLKAMLFFTESTQYTIPSVQP
jgi:hypothetical protein